MKTVATFFCFLALPGVRLLETGIIPQTYFLLESGITYFVIIKKLIFQYCVRELINSLIILSEIVQNS